MNGEGQENGIAESGAAARASGTSARHLSIEERRRLVAESLRVGNPGNKSRELPTQADPRHDCQIELEVDDIRPYENNPRRAGNAKFDEIKESIRSSGIRNPLTVTRRPGEAHFIVEAGGNTRLAAIQQLWAETRDARFRKLVVLFRPWRSEAHVLASHLVENTLRGEMTFWDKACGVVALKARLEAEGERALSLKQLADEMKGLGLSVNTATLAHYVFATERLPTLGEAVSGLSGLDVKAMQPRFNAMKRYGQARASLAEDDLYATVFEPVFRQVADQYGKTQVFSASEVCTACEEALARQLGEPVAQVRTATALDALGRTSLDASGTSPAPDDTSRPVQPAAIGLTTVGKSSRSEPAVSTANAGSDVSARQIHTGVALPSNGEKPFVLSRFVEQVRIFARLAGVLDCLRLEAAAPLGYCMDALPIPTDGDPPTASRQRAWWLLAIVSGQLDHAASACAQDGSTAGDPGTNDGAGRAPGNPPPPFAFDAAFVGWLVDAHDETASAFWNVLALARELRALASRARAIEGPIQVRAADA